METRMEATLSFFFFLNKCFPFQAFVSVALNEGSVGYAPKELMLNLTGWIKHTHSTKQHINKCIKL